MINPEEKELRALEHVAKNVPAVQEWLERWKATEMDRLPVAPAQNVAVQQGRCQVLRELCQALTDAPSNVAKSQQG